MTSLQATLADGAAIPVSKDEIIEWYDGVVSAVISVGAQVHAALLVAWMPGDPNRVFAFVPVDSVKASRLRDLLAEQSKASGHQLQEELKRIRLSQRGAVVVAVGRDVGLPFCVWKEVPSEIVQELRYERLDAEAAIDAARMAWWLDELGVVR